MCGQEMRQTADEAGYADIWRLARSDLLPDRADSHKKQGEISYEPDNRRR